MKRDGHLDSEIVDMAVWNLDQILDMTKIRCRPVLNIYEKLWKEYDQFLELKSGHDKIRFALSIQEPISPVLWP